MNVKQVGHNIEQPTKLSLFKPEIAIFSGYSFTRRSNTVIEVWKPNHCECCDAQIALDSHFVRSQSLDDAAIQRHGLIKYEGQIPPRGIKVHTAAPFMCEPCKEKWLRGEALERIQ